MGACWFSHNGRYRILRALCSYHAGRPKVSSGHGLDTYHTFWLVEFNYVSLLVMFGAVIVVILIGGVLRLHEYFQWRALEKKYGLRNDNT